MENQTEKNMEMKLKVLQGLSEALNLGFRAGGFRFWAVIGLIWPKESSIDCVLRRF